LIKAYYTGIHQFDASFLDDGIGVLSWRQMIRADEATGKIDTE
jgi:hypothetical protein